VFAFLDRYSIAATLMMSFATTWLIDAIVFYLHPLGASQELGIFFIVFAAFALLMLGQRPAETRRRGGDRDRRSPVSGCRGR
jgi:hypothetical protein